MCRLNQGCYDGFSDKNVPFITCLRNPALGREKEYELRKTETPKKILIIGGGVSGLQVATTLKERGHIPVVCEASDSLGGQFVLAGAAPRKEEMKLAAIHMGEVCEKAGIEIRLSTKVTPEVIKDVNPDEVIVAIGSLQ